MDLIVIPVRFENDPAFYSHHSLCICHGWRYYELYYVNHLKHHILYGIFFLYIIDIFNYSFSYYFLYYVNKFFTRWFPLIFLCIPDMFVNYSHLINYTKSSKISLLVFCWVFLQQVWILFYLSQLLNNHARKCKATLFKRYYKKPIFCCLFPPSLFTSFPPFFLPFFLPFTLPFFPSSCRPSLIPFLPSLFPSFLPSFLHSNLPFLFHFSFFTVFLRPFI